MTKVKNIIGSGDLLCKCGSWIKHWRNYTGTSHKATITCSRHGCWAMGTEGGHVIKVDSDDQCTYIVPLCSDHNKGNDEYYVSVPLVPANVAETCG